MNSPVVGPDSHVTITYTLAEEGDTGEPIALGDAPESMTAEYVHGYGQILPALEKALVGRAAGAHLRVVAEPDEAFGRHEPSGVFEIDRDGLAGAEELEVGEEVLAQGPEGDLLMRVLEIHDDSLLVDTNHPLAGKRVRFEVDVVAVRPATDDEIEEAQAALEHQAQACGCGHEHAPPRNPLEKLLQLGKKL